MDGEDLATTVLTCEGDITDPTFPYKLQHLVTKLQRLISDEEKPIKVTKVEPWNSVRVTFNIPQEAAQRLRQLAERGDRVLRELGILSVQIEGDQVITLTLAGQFNEPQEIVLRKSSESQSDVASVSFNIPNSEPVPGPSSAEPAHKSISQFLGHIVGGASTAAAALSTAARAEHPEVPAKPESSVSFRSPNVIAPASGERIPFYPTAAAVTTATTTAVTTGSVRVSHSVPTKPQAGFGPFPFASMTHAMNTKHGSSSPQYQPVIHVQGASPRLSFTSSVASVTSSRSTFSNSTPTPAVSQPQIVSNPAVQKIHRTLANPVFNNIVSRVTAPNSVSTSRANVALSSPLLVNLLQSETSNLQAHNKLMPPPTLASNQPPKRKRKPRKPKEKPLEDGNVSSPTYSPSPSSPSQSPVGIRSPVGHDSVNISSSYSIPHTSISRSPPISQISNFHQLSKSSAQISSLQPQPASGLSHVQGQPSVSLQSQVQCQLPVTNRHMQGQQSVSVIRQNLGHPGVPHIHPQAQGQPQVHTGNLPLHTHIPVGSPQVARHPSGSIQSYGISVPRSTSINTPRLLFNNRDNPSIKITERTSKENVKVSERSSTSSSTPNNSTPESNPFPSPPSSGDGKTKHLINPFTGQLEPMPSDEDEEEESIGSLPPFPDFEIDTSENGQSERSLSDGGKDTVLSSDTDSGICKSHTDISQSSTEYGPLELSKESKKPEIINKIENVTAASVTSSSVPGEKIKLRLKLDPKSVRESKEAELKERKTKELSSPQVNPKIDVALVNIPGFKKSAPLTSTTTAPEPRVPPLHISLRGPNSAVVVSPRKEDTKLKYTAGKESHSGFESSSKISQKKARSPRSVRVAELSSYNTCGTNQYLDPNEKKIKATGLKEPRTGKEDYWNQNVKNMSGGGIVEMSEKLCANRVTNYETYLGNVNTGATLQRRTSVPSVLMQDPCKSEVITLTSCATGETVNIYTGTSSKSLLPLHVNTGSETERTITIANASEFAKNLSANLQCVNELQSESASNSSVSVKSESLGRESDESSLTVARKSLSLQNNLPHSPSGQTNSTSCVQEITCSREENQQTSTANCISVASTVPPSTNAMCINFTTVCSSNKTASSVKKLTSVASDREKPSSSEGSTTTALVSDATNSVVYTKHQTGNLCNTLSSNILTEVVKSTPLAVSKSVNSDKMFHNSVLDTFHNKEKNIINEVQMNVTVNSEQTANNFTNSKTELNSFADKKELVEKGVTKNPVSSKQAFYGESEECKNNVFSNHTDTCKSPVANLMSVTKREIVKEVVEVTDKGLCLIEVKKPPIAQIITVDSLPIQSRVIEVPSLQTSLVMPKSLAKTGLVEVSSIPSLIPSHGCTFLSSRNALVMQDSVDVSFSSNSCGRDSPDVTSQITSSSSSCLESFPKSDVPCSMSSSMQIFNHVNSNENNSLVKLHEDDNKEQNSSAAQSEESSMDSIDEERRRCMLVSETRTSTPGPPNESKSHSPEIISPVIKDHAASIASDLKNTNSRPDPQCPLAAEALTDTATHTNRLTLIDDPVATENANNVSELSTILTSAEKRNSPGSVLENGMEPLASSSGSSPSDENLSVYSSQESTSHTQPPSLCNSQKNLTCSSHKSEHFVACDRTFNLNKPENSDALLRVDPELPPVHIISDSQIRKDSAVCEHQAVVGASNNSVVTSLLSQGKYLSSETGASSRVRLIFKGNAQHSVLSTASSPTSVVVPINSSKTVPIKLVTLPGGASGLSVRSTSNPNVVEIIGPKSGTVHNSPSSSSSHPSSPVRLVVSKVSPSVSSVNQNVSSNVRSRVVVKSVVVTGTSSSIKLVSSNKNTLSTTASISSTSAITVTSTGTSNISLPIINSVLPNFTSVSETSEVTNTLTRIDSLKHKTHADSSLKASDFNNSDLRLSSSCSSDMSGVESPTLTENSKSVETPSSSSLITSLSSESKISVESDLSQEKIELSNETSRTSPSSDNPLNCENNLNADSENQKDSIVINNFNFKNNLKDEEKVEGDRNDAEKNPGFECKESSGASCNLLNGSDDHSLSNSKDDSHSFSIISSSVVECVDTSDFKLEEPVVIEKEIVVESNVDNSVEKCTDDVQGYLEGEQQRNTESCETEVLLAQPFIIDSVQNKISVSPEIVINSSDCERLVANTPEVNAEKQQIRPFKQPEKNDNDDESLSQCIGIIENKCEDYDSSAKGVEQSQLEISLVYSKPLKRKCSENAAELIKACMGVEDCPKRGLLIKQKLTDDAVEKADSEKSEDNGRMNLRVRRDDSTKKIKNFPSSDGSSDEEMALSELVSKSRVRERTNQSRPSSRDTPTELNNFRIGRRRSGSNESHQSDEITKTRSSRDCKREAKKDETVKKVIERTKRSSVKVQRGNKIKEQEIKAAVLSKEENSNVAKRKTRGAGNSETVDVLVPVKRRRYSKDGHR